MTADAALAAYSRGPATALGVDHAQRADLVVLAPEVRLEDPSTLWHGKRIGYVIAGGRVVHGN